MCLCICISVLVFLCFYVCICVICLSICLLFSLLLLLSLFPLPYVPVWVHQSVICLSCVYACVPVCVYVYSVFFINSKNKISYLIIVSLPVSGCSNILVLNLTMLNSLTLGYKYCNNRS